MPVHLTFLQGFWRKGQQQVGFFQLREQTMTNFRYTTNLHQLIPTHQSNGASSLRSSYYSNVYCCMKSIFDVYRKRISDNWLCGGRWLSSRSGFHKNQKANCVGLPLIVRFMSNLQLLEVGHFPTVITCQTPKQNCNQRNLLLETWQSCLPLDTTDT